MPNSDQIKPVNVPKPKSKNRISKRQRQRRRNKQKQALIANQIRNKTLSTSASESSANQQNIAFSENAHQNGVAAWNAAYNNAVRWHAEHQNNFWRHATERLLNENQMLRDQLFATAASIKPEMNQEQDYYETSDEDDDDAKDLLTIKTEGEKDDEVDSEYLEFLQVTIQHREQLRLKREAADKSEDEAATTAEGE